MSVGRALAVTVFVLCLQNGLGYGRPSTWDVNRKNLGMYVGQAMAVTGPELWI